MSKAPVLISAGYGPSTAHGVAKIFGSNGFSVACVGRTQSKLDDGVAKLTSEGVEASAFVCDCGDVEAVTKMVQKVQATLGKVAVIHWNAFSPAGGDLLTADKTDLTSSLNVGCAGLVAATQAALSDIKEAKGSILVTGGILSKYDEDIDQTACDWTCMGLAVTKGAQKKLVGVLNKKLAPDGVMVGEVVITGTVKGSAFDAGNGNVEPDDIGKLFYEMHDKREKSSVSI